MRSESPRPVLRLVLAAILAGSPLAGCSGDYDIGSSPQTLNYGDKVPTSLPPPLPPPPPPVPPSVEPGSDVQADAPLSPPDDLAPDQAAVGGPTNHHRARLARLTAPDIHHDLTVAAGGYVVGRQAEHLVRRTLKRRSLAAASETAETSMTGAGVAATGAAATRAETGEAITAGGEGAAAEEVGAAARAAGVLGGEEIAGAGLAAGASELIIGGLVLGGAAVIGYELYESYVHAHQEKIAHGQ
jgi:hypothetical protein